MAYIDEIREKNLETSKGEKYNDTDLIYINALHTVINNIRQRYLKRVSLLCQMAKRLKLLKEIILLN